MRLLTEDQIRLRAFHLWKAAGEPGGSRDCFWYQAEKEILAEQTAQEMNGLDLRGASKEKNERPRFLG